MRGLTTAGVSAIVLCLAGAAGAQDFDPAPYNAFVPGVTTKAEARRILGRPIAEAPSFDGHTTLQYEYDSPQQAGSRIRMVLLFDRQQKFVRYRAYGIDLTPPAAQPD